jgi:hypothetical protein
VFAALATSTRVSPIGLPLSRRCRFASASWRCMIRSAMRYSTCARRCGFSPAQSARRHAASAATTASAASSAFAVDTSMFTDWSAG